MRTRYGYIKSFHVRTLAFGVFLCLLTYYAIVVFHWQFLTSWIASWTFPVFGYGLMVALVATAKGGMALRIYSHQGSGEKAWNAVLLVSFYLCAALFSVGLAIKAGEWWSAQFPSQYWEQSHWFWVCLSVMILFALVGFVIWRADLVSWKMLQDLKTIPIVSPVFCFGAPILWTNNLAYASFDVDLISTYSTLSILAGTLFLIYLVAFGTLNHKFQNANGQENTSIFDAKGKPVAATQNESWIATVGCLAVFGSALYVFLIVLVDIIIRLSAA